MAGRLNAFKNVKFLGKGSYGSVSKVVRLEDSREYAMKSIDITAMNQREREEAANEIRILASVRHYYVIRYYEAFVEDSKLYIITEYARGGDLYAKVKRQRAKNRYLDEDDVWSFFIQICLGLRALHNKNILHRDLKSPNIFLTGNGDEIKIGDLGVSRVLKKDSELARTQVGTPYYVSPEIWKNRPYDAKCDIWSLGCLLYEMAALKRPFEAENLKALVQKVYTGRYQPLPSVYGPDLHEMVAMLLQTDPSRRPSIQDILEMPSVMSRMKLVPFDDTDGTGVLSEDGAMADVPLRSTIKVPRNLRNLTAHLPSPCYSTKKASSAVNAARNIVKGYVNRERQGSASGSAAAGSSVENKPPVRLPNVGSSGAPDDGPSLPPRAPLPPRPRSTGGDKENQMPRRPSQVAAPAAPVSNVIPVSRPPPKPPLSRYSQERQRLLGGMAQPPRPPLGAMPPPAPVASVAPPDRPAGRPSVPRYYRR